MVPGLGVVQDFKGRQGRKPTTMKRAFVSYDYDHDYELYRNLLSQSRASDSPFTISDASFERPVVDENWKKVARDRIRSAELVIFICGENTHSAKGVEVEMTITQQEHKPYFLLKGRRSHGCSMPPNARRRDNLEDWTWPDLHRLINRRH